MSSHILLFVISIAYYDRPAGSICDEANHVMRSKEECTDALKALGYPTTVSYWSGYASSIPSGCSIRNGGDNMPHMELSSSGKGNGRSDLIPICKGSVTSGKLQLYRQLILESFFVKINVSTFEINYVFYFFFPYFRSF